MKNSPFFLVLILSFPCYVLLAQSQDWKQFEANEKNPFGLMNPDAPKQLADFEPMIGECDCTDIRRNPDGTWQDTSALLWSFKYVLNGTAIQDQTWRESGYASSLRQFHKDSAVWVVNYNSYPLVSTLGTVWKGKKINDDIVLKAKQKAPNGMDGYSRLTFYNMSISGFDWKGEWVSLDGTIIYPFWKIWCEKRDEKSYPNEKIKN